MKNLKLYICAAVFILLTAVKLISPQTGELIGDRIKDMLRLEEQQTQEIIELGSAVAEDGFTDALRLMYAPVSSAFKTISDEAQKLIPAALSR